MQRIESSRRVGLVLFALAWPAAAQDSAPEPPTREPATREPAAQEPAARPSPPGSARPGKAAPRPLDEVVFVRMEAALRARPGDLRLGSKYRQAAIEVEAYGRAIELFRELVAAHPDSAGAHLGLGYALVDKIPAEGAITQVLLANEALGQFSRALELEESWLGYYTRGNSYCFWPAIFGRTPLAIADLERALELAEEMEKRPHHARAWIGLGDAHWRLEDLERAREIWAEAARRFPENEELAARLGREGEALDSYLEEFYDANKRVDTDLSVLWEER